MTTPVREGSIQGQGLLEDSTHPVVLDELLHVVLRQVVGLDVGLHKLLVGDGPQVRQPLQLHEELLEVQLHQRTALVAALLHVSVAGAGGGDRKGEHGGGHSNLHSVAV